jgi:hypothetical protein
MKRIVNGKRFDTSTAVCIASWHNGCYGSDFRRCQEALYRTARGNFFIAGEGGPMSKFARSVGNNSFTGGDGLSPITPEEARQWLEEKGFTEELEEHFAGEIEEA